MYTQQTCVLDLPLLSCVGPQRYEADPELTLRNLDEFIVRKVAHLGDKLSLYLGVESSVMAIATKNHPNDCERALREVLDKWLKGAPGTGGMARTWPCVLRAMESVEKVD